MTARLRSKGRFGVVVVTAGLAVAVTACGSQPPPSKTAPELTRVLSQVDSALARGDYAAARDALANLTQRTAAERTAGHLTQDQAARILTAVARLGADLPAATTPTMTPTPTPPPSPTPSGKSPGKGKGHKGDHEPSPAEGDGGD